MKKYSPELLHCIILWSISNVMPSVPPNSWFEQETPFPRSHATDEWEVGHNERCQDVITCWRQDAAGRVPKHLCNSRVEADCKDDERRTTTLI